MHVQYRTVRQKANNQSQHKDLTQNTMCISSPRPPDFRWLCYEKHYKGDYQNSQIADVAVPYIISSQVIYA